MDQFTSGELKPSDDPSMMEPLKSLDGDPSEHGEKDIADVNTID